MTICLTEFCCCREPLRRVGDANFGFEGMSSLINELADKFCSPETGADRGIQHSDIEQPVKWGKMRPLGLHMTNCQTSFCEALGHAETLLNARGRVLACLYAMQGVQDRAPS